MKKYDIDWGNQEETVLVLTLHTLWKKQDYKDALSELFDITITKNHEVHLLVDFQSTQLLPKDMVSILRYGATQHINNLGLIVIISRSIVWRKLYRVFGHILPDDIQLEFASDSDEAYEHLKSVM